jgi:hypothetical protein
VCDVILDNKYIMDGWACCHCQDNMPGFKTYNGLHRRECKACGTEPCEFKGESDK